MWTLYSRTNGIHIINHIQVWHNYYVKIYVCVLRGNQRNFGSFLFKRSSSHSLEMNLKFSRNDFLMGT